MNARDSFESRIKNASDLMPLLPLPNCQRTKNRKTKHDGFTLRFQLYELKWNQSRIKSTHPSGILISFRTGAASNHNRLAVRYIRFWSATLATLVIGCKPRGIFFSIGDDRDRTDNPCLAKAVLSQLSYVPEKISCDCSQTITRDLRYSSWRTLSQLSEPPRYRPASSAT